MVGKWSKSSSVSTVPLRPQRKRGSGTSPKGKRRLQKTRCPDSKDAVDAARSRTGGRRTPPNPFPQPHGHGTRVSLVLWGVAAAARLRVKGGGQRRFASRPEVPAGKLQQICTACNCTRILAPSKSCSSSYSDSCYLNLTIVY